MIDTAVTLFLGGCIGYVLGKISVAYRSWWPW